MVGPSPARVKYAFPPVLALRRSILIIRTEPRLTNLTQASPSSPTTRAPPTISPASLVQICAHHRHRTSCQQLDVCSPLLFLRRPHSLLPRHPRPRRRAPPAARNTGGGGAIRCACRPPVHHGGRANLGPAQSTGHRQPFSGPRSGGWQAWGYSWRRAGRLFMEAADGRRGAGCVYWASLPQQLHGLCVGQVRSALPGRVPLRS